MEQLRKGATASEKMQKVYAVRDLQLTKVQQLRVTQLCCLCTACCPYLCLLKQGYLNPPQ